MEGCQAGVMLHTLCSISCYSYCLGFVQLNSHFVTNIQTAVVLLQGGQGHVFPSPVQYLSAHCGVLVSLCSLQLCIQKR